MENVPINCSLSTPEQTDRLGWWNQVNGRAIERKTVNGGVQVTFPLEDEEEIRRIAEAESTCCGFLNLEVERTDKWVVLVMTSDNPEAMPVIVGLTGVEVA